MKDKRILPMRYYIPFVVFAVGGIVLIILSVWHFASLAMTLASTVGTISLSFGAYGWFNTLQKKRHSTSLTLSKSLTEWTLYKKLSLPTHWGTIDAVAVGPAGIFVLNEFDGAGFISHKGSSLYRNGSLVSHMPLEKLLMATHQLSSFVQKSIHEKVSFIPVLVMTHPFSIFPSRVHLSQGTVSLVAERKLSEFITQKMYPLPANIDDIRRIFKDLSKR